MAICRGVHIDSKLPLPEMYLPWFPQGVVGAMLRTLLSFPLAIGLTVSSAVSALMRQPTTRRALLSPGDMSRDSTSQTESRF
jgi:hypothetical protein